MSLSRAADWALRSCVEWGVCTYCVYCWVRSFKCWGRLHCYLRAVLLTHFAGNRHREAICIMIIHLEASVESGIWVPGLSQLGLQSGILATSILDLILEPSIYLCINLNIMGTCDWSVYPCPSSFPLWFCMCSIFLLFVSLLLHFTCD